jgi:hypothetical protein
MGARWPRFANTREYARYYGLSLRTLARAKADAIVMHPGPINRGVEMMPDGRRRRALGHPRAGHLGRGGADGGPLPARRRQRAPQGDA